MKWEIGEVNNETRATFGSVYNKNSKILILGSFPSVKSRELNFYYGHPQNRFWKLMSKIYNEEIGDEIDLKKQFLLKNNIALWDTLKSCEIKGSSDASITNVEINNIEELIKKSNISKIIFNGKTAYNLFVKNADMTKYSNSEIRILPSTSPANAAYSLDKLFDIWSKELK